MRRCGKKIPSVGCDQRWCLRAAGHGGECSPNYDEAVAPEPVLEPEIRRRFPMRYGQRRPR